jgi:hypothetical protein
MAIRRAHHSSDDKPASSQSNFNPRKSDSEVGWIRLNFGLRHKLAREWGLKACECEVVEENFVLMAEHQQEHGGRSSSP